MEKIVKMLYKNETTFFLDLQDTELSVVVTPLGSIILHEGIGENRIDHAFIPENMVTRIFYRKIR